MSKPLRILVIGYLPPPYFGPSVTFQALMRSTFARRFAVTFLNQNVVQRVSDLERVSLWKLVKLLQLLGRQLWYLLTQRYDYCLLSVSTNRNAFLKEAAFIQLAHLFGVPSVLYAHAKGFAEFHAQSSPRLQRFISRTVSDAAAAIVMGETLRADFAPWLPPERIFVVGSGIEPAALPPRNRQDNGFVILFLGNLIAEKGIFTLLESIPAVITVCPQARFVFAGDWKVPADKQRAELLIATQGLATHVEFAGVVWGERKAQLIANADLMAFPTHYPLEAHPLVLVEGLEAGLPVVTTGRAAIPEIIRDGVNGFLVREQDPADTAAKINRLINDPALRQQMRAVNRQRFEQVYTHERYGDRMVNVFEELAGRTT